MTLNTLTICHNPLDPETWETIHTDGCFLDIVMARYATFPTNGRIYHNSVSEETDVTPTDDADSVDYLVSLEGHFFLVLYPEEAITIVSIIVAVVAVAAAFLLKPKIPNIVDAKNNSRGSSNNSLSDRTNEARPNSRIPCIFGTLQAIPDLAALPYKTLSGSQEIEHAVMCVGEGSYAIHNVLDDTTKFNEIAGNSAMFYRPHADVVNDTPYYTLGPTFIGDPVYNARGSSSVTGQTLMPADSGRLQGDNNIYFKYPDTINTDDTDTDFTDYFIDGDTLTITGSEYATGKNLDGTYLILSLTSSEIILASPNAVNPNWDDLDNLSGDRTGNLSPVLVTDSVKWVGPFDFTMAERDRFLINIRGPNGIYYIGKNTGNQYKVTLDFQIEFTQLDASGNPTSTVEYYNGSISGSATSRDAVGITVDYVTSFTGPARVRVRRLTSTDIYGDNQFSDTIKVSEIYAVETLNSYSFGDVTILRTKTYSTAGALSIKDRKTKVLVTREIPIRVSGNEFTPDLHATNWAADIICFAALTPSIGNRQISELDVDNIYSMIANVASYFGTTLASEFSYTFDETNISFEETIAAIADAVFCKAYRRGSQIKLTFERSQDSSVMLFNHRNKLPGSETRTATFGFIDDNDGIELEYVSPTDDAKVTYYIPEDQSALNPKKLTTVGVRSKVQAHFIAWRAYNKLRFQNMTAEFTATDESSLLLLTDRIMNSDNTRPIIMEGEVNDVDGLQLTLSQDVNLTPGDSYSIFLQLSDETVQGIAIVAGPTKRTVILSAAPRLPLVTSGSNYAKTVYQIVGSSDTRQLAFLVNELEPESTYTNKIKAINYDSRYYDNDTDFINGVISED